MNSKTSILAKLVMLIESWPDDETPPAPQGVPEAKAIVGAGLAPAQAEAPTPALT